MSATAVGDVLNRTMTDEAFLDRYREDPGAALEGYDLTEEERTALLSGDDGQIHDALGEVKMEWEIAIVVVVS